MGFFDFLRKREQSEDEGGETGPCPYCGTTMTKRYSYSEESCPSCHYPYGHPGAMDDDDDDDDQALSVYDAALIWASNGKDEDYMFGYSEEELEAAL